MTIGTSNGNRFELESLNKTITTAILAMKGSGKSYTASVMAEELLGAGRQVIALDPTGAWWGLQSSADGKKEGFQIAVFGGDHQNIPLEESAGEVVASAIIDHGYSAVIDLSHFRKGQMHRFAADFLETLYRKNRQAVYLFVDEADSFAPQKPWGDQARVLGAMEDIVRRGRIRGIRSTLITQRPSVINKDVLTQCDCLFTLRMSHPRDINAIGEWVKVHADEKQAIGMLQSLPSLPTGTAWVWSPMDGVFGRVEIRKRKTFNSGATPDLGEKLVEPKRLAQVDIERLGESIKQTVERAKANDPKALKAQVAKLTAELASKSKISDAAAIEQQIETAIAERDSFWQKIVNRYEGAIIEVNLTLSHLLPKISAEVLALPDLELRQKRAVTKVDPKPARTIPIPARSVRHRSQSDQGETKPSKCERAILTALAQLGESSKPRVGIFTGYSINSGGFNNALSSLRVKGLISGAGVDLSITEDGLNTLGEYEPLPTGAELRRYWLNRSSKCEAAILNELINTYPATLGKNEMGEATGYSANSGGFNNSLSRLRTQNLIEGYGNNIKASDNLFE